MQSGVPNDESSQAKPHTTTYREGKVIVAEDDFERIARDFSEQRKSHAERGGRLDGKRGRSQVIDRGSDASVTSGYKRASVSGRFIIHVHDFLSPRLTNNPTPRRVAA
ncbi:hypothetical protein IAQ61_002309 [Plenodomus lingam]|uniref:uncharacterized protein n=1 Tax=Leptosphaeria maculans TaxID=5022 RepID=UPI00332FF41E|nr:hypothetical protein IAQ61_002309 [Plenodomus lingam]